MNKLSNSNNHGIPNNGVNIINESNPFLNACFSSIFSVPNFVVAILIVANASIIKLIDRMISIGPMNDQINPSSCVMKQCSSGLT